MARYPDRSLRPFRGLAPRPFAPLTRKAEVRENMGNFEAGVWAPEGCERIVIITNSDYVETHATSSLGVWAKQD